MIYVSKSIVVLIVVVCILLVVMAWAFVRGSVGLAGVENYEGYFAPVYSPDGQYVYFVERRTSGTVKETVSMDLFLSSSKFDVSVAKDTFSLKRLQVQNGQIEELIRFSPSPIEGKSYEVIASPFHVPHARLRFTKGQQLEFNVCLTTHHQHMTKDYVSSGIWIEAQHTAEITGSWKEAYCWKTGYDEWPLFGDWELMEVRGDRGYFPVAIIAYNHVTNGVKVLVKNKDYDRFYPDGVPLPQIQKSSRRPGMERDQTVRRTHEELLQKYKAMGMGEAQALLQTGKDMQRLGYYPKTPTMVARRLDREETARTDLKDALFTIAKGEMEAGLFQDIERAIASPGQETDKTSDGYFTHRDYTTSARLNAYLKTGKKQFYVRYLGETYEVTIKQP